MQIDNIQKSNIISFVAGFMQSATFILAYVLVKYFADLTMNQNFILGSMILANEVLTYVLMRLASVISKK